MIGTRINRWFGRISEAPPDYWVLLGFSVPYLLFFLQPIFFSARVMQFYRYVPTLRPIGADLIATVDFSRWIFVGGPSPYLASGLNPVPISYPPLTALLLSPLLLTDFSWAYRLVTLASVFCFVVMTLAFPLGIAGQRQPSSLLMFVFLTGLFSYGLQFELERGQFNLIAMSMCFLAIWIYHQHHRHRYWAYLLFTLSIQLKVYPLIFVVMLVTNWHDWRGNIKRFLVLGLINFGLLFVLGPNVFMDFLDATIMKTAHPMTSMIWAGNHSISAFTELSLRIAERRDWVWLSAFSGWVPILLLATTVLCIGFVVYQSYLHRRNGADTMVLVACTLGALIIPSFSHDYTLPILAGPVAVLFSRRIFWERPDQPGVRGKLVLPLLVLATAYSTTLFPLTNKPDAIRNNFPALFTMLLVITVLSSLASEADERRASEPMRAA